MIIQKVPHYVDSVLTQEVASAALQGGDVVVAWYTNQVNSQSVVHSHPYYEHGTATPSSWMQTPSCTGISAACWNGWHRLSHWTKGYAPSCNAAR